MYKKSYLSRSILLLPAVLLYISLGLYPQIQTLYYSFFRWNGIGEKVFIGFENFIALFKDEIVLVAIGNSFRLLLVNFVFQMGIAFVLAYILSTRLKGWKFFRFAYFVPCILSGTIIGFIWKFVYSSKYGLLNSILESINLSALTTSWLGNIDVARWAIAFPGAIQWMGFGVVIYMTAISNINHSLIESAKIDGARNFKIMIHIVFPLIKSIAAMNMIYMIKGVLQSFDVLWMLTEGKPLNMTHSMATLAYTNIFRYNVLGYGSAIAFVIFIISVILAIISKLALKTDS